MITESEAAEGGGAVPQGHIFEAFGEPKLGSRENIFGF